MAIEIVSRMGPRGLAVEIYIPDNLLERPRYVLWAELIDGLRSLLFEDGRKESN